SPSPRPSIWLFVSVSDSKVGRSDESHCLARLWASAKEASGDFVRVHALRIGRVVHFTHVRSGNTAGQTLQSLPDLRVTQQRGRPRHGHGIIRRKEVAVVFELNEIEALDQTCRGVARNQIDLT